MAYNPSASNDKLHFINLNFGAVFGVTMNTAAIVSTSFISYYNRVSFYVLLSSGGVVQMVDIGNIVDDDETTEMKRIQFELCHEENELFSHVAIDRRSKWLFVSSRLPGEEASKTRLAVYELHKTVDGSVDLALVDLTDLEGLAPGRPRVTEMRLWPASTQA